MRSIIAFFIETKPMMYRFSFITLQSQSERNEVFIWSVFSSLVFMMTI
ncbi:hypothetical protein [Cohaesibacter celericrescens]|nr:hypothetical protein [Cohaesibacter celericrescens]